MRDAPPIPVVPMVMRTPPRRAALRLRWFVPGGLWVTMVSCGLAVVFFGTLTHPTQSMWVWIGAALSLVIVWHTVAASRRLPWLPGLIATIAALQWVLATMGVYYSHTLMDGVDAMAVPAREYFAFAVPSLLALVAGLWYPLRHESSRRIQELDPGRAHMSAQLRTVCEAMVWGGLVVRFLQPFAPGSLKFAVLLVGQLAFVGAFSETIARTPGWWIRLAAVLVVELGFSARDAMFLQTVLWGSCAGALLVYRYRLRVVWVVSALGAALVVIVALNAFKHRYRNELSREAMTDAERTEAVSSQVTALLAQPSGLFSKENLAFNLARLNQGGITSHVLAWVPAAEPYAGGETIATGLRAAVLPRVLDPTKYVAGGSEYFERFTGLTLLNGTSMNLSIPGEMYANFGYAGGLLGVLVYGLCIGLVFRFVLRWARRSPLWWAWAPYVLLGTLSAEDGFGETVNRVSKALLVMLVVAHFVPAWRAIRPVVRRRSRRLPSPALVPTPLHAPHPVEAIPDAG